MRKSQEKHVFLTKMWKSRFKTVKLVNIMYICVCVYIYNPHIYIYIYIYIYAGRSRCIGLKNNVNVKCMDFNAGPFFRILEFCWNITKHKSRVLECIWSGQGIPKPYPQIQGTPTSRQCSRKGSTLVCQNPVCESRNLFCLLLVPGAWGEDFWGP
jgi:hypothetical protein